MLSVSRFFLQSGLHSGMNRIFAIQALASALALAATARHAAAHATEQSFVLLLPTELYTAAGVGSVVLTVVALSLIPPKITLRIFSTADRPRRPLRPHVGTAISLASLALFVVLLILGLSGSRDPLHNPLPLFVWTIWWILMPIIQAVFGDVWKILNPWTGLYDLLLRAESGRALLKLPERLGAWLGVATLFGFASFTLAYPAPDDPDRLAWFVAGYWVFTFAGMAVFGKGDWLSRCECLTMLLGYFARLAPVRAEGESFRIGVPGWKICQSPPTEFGAAAFALSLLAFGSFDGLNETFWWLAQLDINPLEFPGRSAVVIQTVFGIAFAIMLLSAIFVGCVWAGHKLAGPDASEGTTLTDCIGRFALSILPIALGYHFAHYLTSFMVNGQYAIAAASDPLDSGRDLLGLGTFRVTTGFFNTLATVRAIWLAQCVAIVLGHILAVLLAHAIAIDHYGKARRAAASQIPLAALMVLYTLFSLWLLASPRGA